MNRALSHTYRYYVTVFPGILIWELYRLNRGQFELVYEFIGLKYDNWNTIDWDLIRRIAQHGR